MYKEENKFDCLEIGINNKMPVDFAKKWDRNKTKIEKILSDNHLYFQSLKIKAVNGSGKPVYPRKNYLSKLRKDYIEYKTNNKKISNESLATISLLLFAWKGDIPDDPEPVKEQTKVDMTLENTQKIIDMLSNGVSFTTEKKITETSNIEMVVNDPKPIVIADEVKQDDWKTVYEASLTDYDESSHFKNKVNYYNFILCKEFNNEKIVVLKNNPAEAIGEWWVETKVDCYDYEVDILHIKILPHDGSTHKFKAYNFWSNNEDFIYKDEEWEGKDEGDICNQVHIYK